MKEKITEKVSDKRTKVPARKRKTPGEVQRLKEERNRVHGEQDDAEAVRPDSKLARFVKCLLKKAEVYTEKLGFSGEFRFENIGAHILDGIFWIHKAIGNILIRLIKICSVPFRYIHAGISYALLFLLIACGLMFLKQSGDGAALMKNPAEMLPALQRNKNEIAVSDDGVSMLFPSLDAAQRKVFLELKKEYSVILALRRELERLKDSPDLSEEDRKAQEAEIRNKLNALQSQLVRNAKPITGFGADALRNIRSVTVTPEILEVTITVVNVNQNDEQNFTFRLFNPDMDIEAGNLPVILKDSIAAQLDSWIDYDTAVMPQETAAICEHYREWKGKNPSASNALITIQPAEFLQAEWLLQNAIIQKLCHRIRENQSYATQYEEALKKKDAADLAARKMKDEKKRNEILSKRVQDYFCDSVSAAERDLLDVFILATNKDEITSNSANRHEIEKVYIYVSRIPPKITFRYESLNDVAIVYNFQQLLQYPDPGDFVFAASDASSNLKRAFDFVHTKIIPPAEQAQRITDYLKRDIIGEEINKINAALIAEADYKKKQNQIRIENEVLLTISRRPEGLAELTDEGRENIRREVIAQLNLKDEEPVLKKREDISREDKQRWLDTAIAEAGINPANLFYQPLALESIRENEQLNAVNNLFSGTTVNWLVAFFCLCALLAFCAPGSQYGVRVFNLICKYRGKEELILNTESKVLTIIRNVGFWSVLTGMIVFFLYWFALLWTLCDVPDQVLNTITEKDLFYTEEKALIWLHYFWYWFPGLILWIIAVCALFTNGTKKDFARPVNGESFIAALFAKKNGNTPFAGSFLWIVCYILIFLLLPYMLVFQYINIIPNPSAPTQEEFMQLDSYNIPAGGGDAMPQQAVKVKVKKKKVRKYIVNPRTSIIFDIPPLNDEEHIEEIDAATETQYTTGSMFGKGKKTGKPGWAGGMESAKIRFIRLQYNGGNWDWHMGKGGDYNMLKYLHDKIGFEVADDTESVTVNKLARGFRKGKKPPFIYIHGTGSINLNATEVKQLNEYLLKDGGMIFADAASLQFGQSFRALMRRVLPNHKLVEIANDDPIFRAPYFFPNGAPAFFHHDGFRALGIKNNGRWIVFYHPGDLGDAWIGGGLTEQQRAEAFKLGSNVMSYAFAAYLESNSSDK